MNEDSDYYSNSDSESEKSDNEVVDTQNIKPLFKPSLNIKAFEGDAEVSDEEDDFDDADPDEEEEVEDPITKIINEDDDEDDDDFEDDDEVSDDEEDIQYDKDGDIIVQQKVVKSLKVKKAALVIDNDDDDDDDYDENYLQKFDNEISKNYIDEFHPECLNHNYDEIAKLTIVVKNSDGIIIDPLHRTIPFLTKYEKARILGQRSKQIETGSRPYVKVPENIIDGYIIAELELKENKIPFIIKRPIPGGGFEYWNLKDLENISF